MAVVTGKGYGATNLIALDRSSENVIKADVVVQRDPDPSWLSDRGVERKSYELARPIRERTKSLGDTGPFFWTPPAPPGAAARGGGGEQRRVRRADLVRTRTGRSATAWLARCKNIPAPMSPAMITTIRQRLFNPAQCCKRRHRLSRQCSKRSKPRSPAILQIEVPARSARASARHSRIRMWSRPIFSALTLDPEDHSILLRRPAALETNQFSTPDHDRRRRRNSASPQLDGLRSLLDASYVRNMTIQLVRQRPSR